MNKDNDILVIASAFFEIDDMTKVLNLHPMWVPEEKVWTVPTFDQALFDFLGMREDIPGVDSEIIALDTTFKHWLFGYGPLSNTLVIVDYQRY